jgi:hypothetical protein
VSADLPPDAPALVLAVPRSPAAGAVAQREGWGEKVVAEIASQTRSAHNHLDIRTGVVAEPVGDGTTLIETLRDIAELRRTQEFGESSTPESARDDDAEETEPRHELSGLIRRGGPVAIVVPLLTGPNANVYDHLRSTVTASGVPAKVTEPLGPHPLLAEALHVRLAEAGLARADRIRQFSIGAAVDGVVVVTMGGAPAVQEADITAVLLAARLAVPVIAAALDGAPAVADAAARLREAGADRLALAPQLIGPEGDPDLLAAAAAHVNAGHAAPLGAHQSIVRLVNLRYEVALEELAASAAHDYRSEEEAS